jgi:hypothetical protein
VCHDGAWGSVPLSCSAQTRDDWTAHYKTSEENCNNGGYQLVCSGPATSNTTAEVENPCLICPNGATRENDYVPYASEDPITCKELIDNAKLFETDSLWCAQYEEAGLYYCCPTTPFDPCTVCPNNITVADDYEPYNDGNTCSYWLDYYAANFDAESDWCTVGHGVNIESRCCPTVANNPCTICPDGATAGEDIVPYSNDNRTCEDRINATLTFDVESEMCLVWAKQDEYYCCSSNTTTFVDYCNICPNGITASDNFIPWSGGKTCKDLVWEAKVYENGSVGCNYYTGYEMSCCSGAGTADAENTPSSFTSIPTNSPTIGTPKTDPCLICPDGATEGLDDYAPYEDWEDPIACKELINNAKLFETGSIWCAQYEEAGSYCCPITPEDPCTLCPNGITVADDYDPYNSGFTCADWLDIIARNFDPESALCTVGRSASDIKSHCCPTAANNPCTICPDGATVGKEFVPYSDDSRTCEDLINATLTFDADSEMCLVYAKQDEYKCCPSSTTEFNNYCNICPDGITAGDDFVPWTGYETCKDLVENAKIYENGSVGCNFYKGFEMSCCPRAGTVSENTPSSTTTSIPTISPTIGTPKSDAWTFVDKIASIVGVASALVAAAFAFAKWKRKMKSTSTSAIPTTVAPSPNMTSSMPTNVALSPNTQTNVCNTPIPSQPNPTQGPRRSSLGFSRSFSSRI